MEGRRDSKLTGRLSVSDLKEVETEWFKCAQEEMKEQGNFKQLVSDLGVVDQGGIFRCAGRLVQLRSRV